MATLKIMLTVVLCAGVAGCATTMRGAPDSPFDKSIYSNIHLISEKEVDALVNETKKDARNAQVNTMLAAIDINYSRFRANLVANSRQSRSLVDSAILGLNVASSLVGTTGAKDSLTAASTLISGEANIIDKDYLYEKTVTALIAEMDSNRKQKRVDIQTALTKQSITDYPGLSALNDVTDYYDAGTLISAVASVSTNATTKAATAEDQLRKLKSATPEQILNTRKQTAALRTRVLALDTTDLATLSGFLAGKGSQYAPKDQQATSVFDSLKDYRETEYHDDFDGLMKEIDSVIPPKK